MNEIQLQGQIATHLGSKKGVRLFRNTVGVGVVGKFFRRPDGTVTVYGPSYVRFGLVPGSADLIGWRTIQITPEMVGQKIAAFLSVEVKTETGEREEAQVRWHRAVVDAGGISILARSKDDSDKALLWTP